MRHFLRRIKRVTILNIAIIRLEIVKLCTKNISNGNKLIINYLPGKEARIRNKFFLHSVRKTRFRALGNFIFRLFSRRKMSYATRIEKWQSEIERFRAPGRDCSFFNLVAKYIKLYLA